MEKELKLVPYHELSAGQTRDGMEVFHNEDDSYLRSVNSLVDKNAKDYLNSVYINKNVLPERIEIIFVVENFHSISCLSCT